MSAVSSTYTLSSDPTGGGVTKWSSELKCPKPCTPHLMLSRGQPPDTLPVARPNMNQEASIQLTMACHSLTPSAGTFGACLVDSSLLSVKSFHNAAFSPVCSYQYSRSICCFQPGRSADPVSAGAGKSIKLFLQQYMANMLHTSTKRYDVPSIDILHMR